MNKKLRHVLQLSSTIARPKFYSVLPKPSGYTQRGSDTDRHKRNNPLNRVGLDSWRHSIDTSTGLSTTVSEPIKVAISSFDLIGSTHDAVQPIAFQEGATKPIELDAVVEVPRGSFLKRGSTGKVDFISPVPCPFNYGSVPQYLGREGDLLDAVVLGPRLPYGSHVRVKVWGAVILTDHGMSDDKLICSSRPVTGADRRRLLRFFHLYAKCKGLLNFCRRRPGRNACEGWCEAEQAMARARPRPATWQGPPVKF